MLWSIFPKKVDMILNATKIIMDVGTVQGWLAEKPQRKRKPSINYLSKQSSRTCALPGVWKLSSISLKGGGGEESRMNGAMNLKTEGLEIHLVAEKRQGNRSSPSAILRTRVTIEEGEPSLQISKPSAGLFPGRNRPS